MAREVTTVKLQNVSLDDRSGEIIAHGWLDIEALESLRVGDYQREILENPRGGRRSSLRSAIEGGDRLPDIMLGMRGEKYTSRSHQQGKSTVIEDMLLENDIYIIDGLQRVSALRKHAADHPEDAMNVLIGAEVRFNTNREIEAALFTKLNVNRKAMSPSVILRNERNTSNGIATLYGLSMHDKACAMLGKVCWDQQMHRGELCTALAFAKVCITLHRHAAPGGRHVSTLRLIAPTADNMASAVGLQNFRSNIVTFFDVVDEVWGLRGIKYTDKATQTRLNFLLQFAAVISDHEDFWNGKRLTIDAGQKSKLKSFPIDDPTIIRLAGSGPSAGILLYRLLIDHMNKGKAVNRHLTTRRVVDLSLRKPANRLEGRAKKTA
jgi:hypothetical protein